MSESNSASSNIPQQPYNHASEMPTTARPVVEVDNPYASLRGTSGNKQLPTFDEDLINKYNRSGPRYTSYLYTSAAADDVLAVDSSSRLALQAKYLL